MSTTAPSILDKERIIASPGFNRWLVPPAALAIHLCIRISHSTPRAAVSHPGTGFEPRANHGLPASEGGHH